MYLTLNISHFDDWAFGALFQMKQLCHCILPLHFKSRNIYQLVPNIQHFTLKESQNLSHPPPTHRISPPTRYSNWSYNQHTILPRSTLNSGPDLLLNHQLLIQKWLHFIFLSWSQRSLRVRAQWWCWLIPPSGLIANY